MKKEIKTTRKKSTAKKVNHPLMINERVWNKEITMQYICAELANSSKSLTTILKEGYEGQRLPSYFTVMQWVINDKTLSNQYAIAKSEQADFLADELLDIVDDCRNDYMDRVIGDETVRVVDKEHISRTRLRVDTRKWLMGKLKPKKYSDKLDLNHGGQADNPLLILAKAVQGGTLMINEDKDEYDE